MRLFFGVLAAALLAIVVGGGQARGSSPAAGAESPPQGATLFRTYCASCHGETGKGNGPMAEHMRKPPADLTHYAQRNGGVFPSNRLRRIIDGRDVPSHGERDMPVWGDVFRTARDRGTAESVDARIEALVKYVEAMQERAAQ